MIARKTLFPIASLLTLAMAISVKSEMPSLQVSLRSDVDPQFKYELEKALDTELALNTNHWNSEVWKDSMAVDPRAGNVQIRLTEAAWKTKKARSLAYLFNRYFKYFRMEVTVIYLYGKEEIKIKSLVAEDGGKPQAQFLSNDYYDGDIFPDQNEKIKIERNVCRKLAKKITKMIAER